MTNLQPMTPDEAFKLIPSLDVRAGHGAQIWYWLRELARMQHPVVTLSCSFNPPDRTRLASAAWTCRRSLPSLRSTAKSIEVTLRR